jgi:hypothetical protein
MPLTNADSMRTIQLVGAAMSALASAKLLDFRGFSGATRRIRTDDLLITKAPDGFSWPQKIRGGVLGLGDTSPRTRAPGGIITASTKSGDAICAQECWEVSPSLSTY